MSKVTYFLGAGASANSLPVIGNMNVRMSKFLDNFLPHQINQKKWKELNFKKLLDQFRIVFDASTKHATIDTYAKKLYLKKDLENLNVLKSLISAYLVYEQTLVHEEYHATGEPKGIASEGDGQLDSRYDSFFASTLNLNNDLIQFNDNISIITWNYDYQIELAYSDFANCTLKEARDFLNIYPREGIINDNKANVVKLNGTVDLHDTIKERAGVSGFFSSNYYVDGPNYPAIYNSIEIALNQLQNYNFHLVPSISFAWERELNKYSEESVYRAKAILNESSTLVVIGYSFPIFNREIDKFIFEGTKVRKIYLQCDLKDSKGVESRIRNTLNIENIEFEFIEGYDQFYIPYEV